ncbi:MAG: hypothetical protein LUQ19_02965, partial [Methanoregula sp.]|nr:hypothetical protein [Methanoregula sp.]
AMAAADSKHLAVLLESVLAAAMTDSPRGRSQRILRILLQPILADATMGPPRRPRLPVKSACTKSGNLPRHAP